MLSPQHADPASTKLSQCLAGCRDTWIKVTQEVAAQPISSFQKEVLRTCRQLDPTWQVLGGEHLTKDKLFSMDVAMLVQGVKVAVEADGPTHYSINTPFHVMGSTTARNRFLQRRGWRVLCVPYYEWARLSSDGAKSQYLKTRLLQVLAQGDAP